MPKPATSRHRLVPFSCTSSPPVTAFTVHDWLARLPLLPGRPACSHTWARAPLTCAPSTTSCGLVSFVALMNTLGVGDITHLPLALLQSDCIANDPVLSVTFPMGSLPREIG